jgi:hypothetical protein
MQGKASRAGIRRVIIRAAKTRKTHSRSRPGRITVDEGSSKPSGALPAKLKKGRAICSEMAPFLRLGFSFGAGPAGFGTAGALLAPEKD